jgi:hypothetical protein
MVSSGHLGARIMGKKNLKLWGIPFFEMPHKHAFGILKIMGIFFKKLWGIPFFEMPHKHAFGILKNKMPAIAAIP